MEHTFGEAIVKPYLQTCDSIITELNDEFVDLTGFVKEELLGKTLMEILDMIRLESKNHRDPENINCSVFIFSKSLEAKEVNIYTTQGIESNQKIYVFVEKPNTRLAERLLFVEQIFNDNIVGAAVYSVPDLILLKANQRSLDFKDAPYNRMEISVGKSFKEIITGYSGSEVEDIWESILETQKSIYLKEFKFDKFERGETFWDSNLTPIFENGMMKYIFETTTEVTQKVLERQQKEKQIQASEKNFRDLFNHMEHGYAYYQIITNETGEPIDYIFMDINPSYERITGLSRDRLIGRKATEVFPQINESSVDWIDIFGEVACTGKSVSMEVYSDIMDRWYSVNYYCPMPGYTASIFSDITFRKDYERRLEETRKRLLEAQEHTHVGDWECDLISKKIHWAEEIYRIFGMMPQAFIPVKNSSYDFIHPEDLEEFKKAEIEFMLKDVVHFQCRYIGNNHKSGWIAVKTRRVFNEEGIFTFLKGTVQDITHDKLVECELTRQKCLAEYQTRQLKAVLENMTEGVIIADIKGNMISMNPVALRMHGLDSFEEFMHITDFQNYIKILDLEGTPIPIEERPMNRAMRGEIFTDYELWVHPKDIDIGWIGSFGGTSINDENGERIMAIITIRDITKQKQLADALKEKSEALEKAIVMKEEFFINISHELKTPLNVIYSTAQLFHMYCKNGSLGDKKDIVMKYIDSIKTNAYRLSKLVNNIVDLSKIEAGFFDLNLSNNNIIEVIEDIVMSVTDYTASKDLNIIFDTDTEEKIIACDIEKIERIILNLISNAVKFTDKGGEILVEIKDQNDFVEISVQDNGIGIKEQYLDVIFDRYMQVNKVLSRNTEGTGIGLSLVKSIVELHGGSILVKSEYGRGSKFIIALPVIKVVQENRLLKNKVSNRTENIKIEFSDIYL